MYDKCNMRLSVRDDCKVGLMSALFNDELEILDFMGIGLFHILFLCIIVSNTQRV